jgi:hypothetical protein
MLLLKLPDQIPEASIGLPILRHVGMVIRHAGCCAKAGC